jgi:glycosyltransferase involved in cell wall biosynthesis
VITLSYADEQNKIIQEGWQKYYGINYEILMGILDKNPRHRGYRSVFIRYKEMFAAGIMGQKRIKDLFKQNHFDAVYVYGLNAIVIAPIIRTVQDYSLPCIFDAVEWPTTKFYRHGILNPLYWIDKRTIGEIAGLCDGIIAISKYIENQYLNRGKYVIRIPAIVETDFFENISIPTKGLILPNEFNLTYIGSLVDKDDPLKMIAVLKLLSEEGYNVILHIIGTNIQTNEGRKFLNIYHNLPIIKDKIIFHGILSDHDFKCKMLVSDALILFKINDQISQASFPTRIPEMLISGRPVVTTDVGDISDYIKDGTHALIAQAGDIIGLTAKIKSLIEDKGFSENIGKNGKKRADEVFNYKHHSQRLFTFISYLINNYEAPSRKS